MSDSPDPLPAVGEAPPLAVNPTATRGVVIALVLALVTAWGAISNLLIFASTRDIAGLIVYLKGNDFLAAISAFGLIGGAGGLAWRAFRRWAREAFLEQHVASSVAYVKGSAADPAIAANRLPSNWGTSLAAELETRLSAPTRARETTTRLVDASAITRKASLTVAAVEALNTPDAIRARDQAVVKRHPNIPEFDAAYDQWIVRPDDLIETTFHDWLLAAGWNLTDKWNPPADNNLNPLFVLRLPGAVTTLFGKQGEYATTAVITAPPPRDTWNPDLPYLQGMVIDADPLDGTYRAVRDAGVGEGPLNSTAWEYRPSPRPSR